MRKQLAAGMAAIALISFTLAAQPQPAEPLDELDTVLVVGEQPGPGLWKVSKGDHVMWVLASYSPLSKDMTWRSPQIETRIVESQEVLSPGNVNIHPDIGMLRGFTIMSTARKAAKNPDGATLKQVLPAELYAKWLVLREKYAGSEDDIEEWRPEVAIGLLQNRVLTKSGLRNVLNLREVVERVARKHEVRIHRTPKMERVVKVENPRGMLKHAGKAVVPDLTCFKRSLEELEPGMERAKQSANAWARGDIAKFRELYRVQQIQDICADAMILKFARDDNVTTVAFTLADTGEVAQMKKLLAHFKWHADQAAAQSQRDWVAAAQVALEQNKSTFSVLPMDDVFRADGHLETLRKLGYTVEEPL